MDGLDILQHVAAFLQPVMSVARLIIPVNNTIIHGCLTGLVFIAISLVVFLKYKIEALHTAY